MFYVSLDFCLSHYLSLSLAALSPFVSESMGDATVQSLRHGGNKEEEREREREREVTIAERRDNVRSLMCHIAHATLAVGVLAWLQQKPYSTVDLFPCSAVDGGHNYPCSAGASEKQQRTKRSERDVNTIVCIELL